MAILQLQRSVVNQEALKTTIQEAIGSGDVVVAKEVPEQTDDGDNISAFVGTATFVSEDLTKQVVDQKLVYNVSTPYVVGSTSLYVNGLFMTRGLDYFEDESGMFVTLFDGKSESIRSETSVISIKYVARP